MSSHRIGFVIFGPPVCFWLLSTPPRGDAVNIERGVMATPVRDFHPADISPSRAHRSHAPLAWGPAIKVRDGLFYYPPVNSDN